MTRALTFDPRLPQLPVLDDPATVAALLAPGIDVAQVRRQDTKYIPGRGCVAAFELRSRAAPDDVLLGAVAVSPDDVVGYPVDRDPALPWLRVALDGTAMRMRFDDTPTAGGPAGECRVTPVRYKPGVRCVLRYDVTAPASTNTFYAKMLSHGVTGEAAVVDRLRRLLAQRAGAAVVLPVTGVWADLGMLVQPALHGSAELHDLATDPRLSVEERRSLFVRVGHALACLHDVEPLDVPQRSLQQDLAELRDYLRVVECADPDCARLFATLLDRLEAADDAAAEQPVITHGAFRTDQLLLAADRLVLIDLDTVCRAEPARDIGNFLAYLDWKTVRRPGLAATAAEISAAFLAGYADVRPLPAPARLALYRAASAAKIVGRRFRSLTTAEWPLVPDLLAVGRQVLATRGVPA